MKEPKDSMNNAKPQPPHVKENSSKQLPTQRFVWGLPLAWQLGVLYALLLIVTLSLVGWLVYSQQEGFLVQDASQRLVMQAEDIATISMRQTDMRDEQGDTKSGADHTGAIRDDHSEITQEHLVQDLVQGLSGPAITVAVLDTNGTVITATQALEGDTAPVVEAVTADRVSQALSTRQPVQWTVATADGSRQVVVLTAVTEQATQGQSASVVLVEQMASLAAVDAALGQLRLLLLLGLIGGTIVGVALVMVFTQGVLRPLERVVDTADAISAGDLHRRLALPGGGSEVARLGKAFDSMVGRLVATLENQRRFVADASHELRTPLTSLKGLAEILVIGAHGNNISVIEQSAQAINSELERLIRLVTDLLTLSKLDNAGNDDANGRSLVIRPKRAPMDACETIQAAASQMAGIALSRSVELSSDCASSLPILGDAGQIKQILLNLIDNALRHTPAGGQVIVRGSSVSGSAKIEVQDTGSGIAAKDLPHIFERFYRGDTSRSRATGNSGLGLAIVKSIVDAHGGSIQVRSLPGEGTCFTVQLPLIDKTQLVKYPMAKARGFYAQIALYVGHFLPFLCMAHCLLLRTSICRQCTRRCPHSQSGERFTHYVYRSVFVPVHHKSAIRALVPSL